MPARRTLSGTVIRQYGSPDFVITPHGTFGGINHDLTYAIYYAFKILFSPKTIGKAAGVAEIEYVTVSSHATWPYEEYNFVQKVCYEFSAKGSQGNGPDLFLSPISIPNSQTDPTSQVPIIPVGVQTLVNVPVSINFTGALPSNILNSSVPVTLQAGSYSSTQNISIASLVANQNQRLVPFLVTFQSNDVGLKTLVASVNATRVISESNFSNNEAHLNVRVGDAKLSIISRALGVDGEPIGVETKTGISGGENISLVLGSRTNFKLVDANGVTQPATYVLDAESKAFSFPIGTNALFRNQMVILFGEGAAVNNQDLLPVHLGSQQLVISPTSNSLPITINISVISPFTLGSVNSQFDSLIIKNANEKGLPPQIVKALVAQESSENFKAMAFRYEPRTNDKKFFSPSKILLNSLAYSKYKLSSKENPELVPLLFPRRKYDVILDGEKIPDNYESIVNVGKYTPLKAIDLISANPSENWVKKLDDVPDSGEDGALLADFIRSQTLPKRQSEFDFTAQTIIASSYGLMQIMYSTAITGCGFTNVNKIGKNPLDLFDPQINIDCGTKILTRSYRNLHPNLDFALSSYTQFESAMRDALQNYNDGQGVRVATTGYHADVWNRLRTYWPAGSNGN